MEAKSENPENGKTQSNRNRPKHINRPLSRNGRQRRTGKMKRGKATGTDTTSMALFLFLKRNKSELFVTGNK